MISIPGNELLLFWQGVNISNIRGDTVRLDTKEYYQLEDPLFAGGGLLNQQNAESNNRLINRIEYRESILLQELKDNPYCAFLSVAKKPVVGEFNRQGYSFRVSAPVNGNLTFIKHLLADAFHIPPVQIEKVFDTTTVMLSRQHYTTHPISGIGFCVKESEPYAQIYITNNRDTTRGIINRLNFDEACDNTCQLFNGCGFSHIEDEVLDLMNSMYSFGMFAAFFGLDISSVGIEKAKVYFRTTYRLDFDGICKVLTKLFALHGKCAELPRWEAVQKAICSQKDNYIDCIAIAFKERTGVLAVDGVQFYLAP